LEQRSIRTTSILTLAQKWKGLAQGFELTRKRTIKGETTVEVVHGMTSLPWEKADAKRLLDLTRGHWGIENGLHYIRDVTLGEDSCRVRKDNSPWILAAVRNAVVHLLDQVDATSHAAALRRLNAHPEVALALLHLPQLE
jgi:predicted transposase YbfD/YdcC